MSSWTDGDMERKKSRETEDTNLMQQEKPELSTAGTGVDAGKEGVGRAWARFGEGSWGSENF